MYVNQRSGFDFVTDPYAGEFGALSDEMTSAAESLASCAVEAIGSASAGATCVWEKIKGIILAQPNAEAILEAITNSSCSSALSSIGLPSEVSSAICVLGAQVWQRVQQMAADELYQLYRARGRERSPAEGGGFTLVDGAGTTVAVECPGVIDGDGRPTLFDPTGPCPASTVGKTLTIIAKKPVVSKTMLPFRPVKTGDSTYKTDDTGTAAKPWYKNKWVWIGAAVVLAGGTAAVVAVRRSR